MGRSRRSRTPWPSAAFCTDWVSTYKRFAKIDASKMSVNKVVKMIKHFNGKTKTSGSRNAGTSRCNVSVLHGPDRSGYARALNVDREKHIKMMESLKIVLKGYEKQFKDKPFSKRSVQFWTDAADTLLAMIVMRLPLPRKAQSISSRI